MVGGMGGHLGKKTADSQVRKKTADSQEPKLSGVACNALILQLKCMQSLLTMTTPILCNLEHLLPTVSSVCNDQLYKRGVGGFSKNMDKLFLGKSLRTGQIVL
jgi:hypothetical protein